MVSKAFWKSIIMLILMFFESMAEEIVSAKSRIESTVELFSIKPYWEGDIKFSSAVNFVNLFKMAFSKILLKKGRSEIGL